MTERDLIFTWQAVQLGLADRDTVEAATRACERGDAATLRAALTKRAELSESDIAYLELSVERVLKQHDGDATATLAGLGYNQAAGAMGLTLPLPATEQPPAEPSASEEDATVRSPSMDDTLTAEAPGRYRSKDDEGKGREIGRGGIGRVLVTFDHHLGREVAVKELLRDVSSDSGASAQGSVGRHPVVTRFLREARVTGQLEHPNIVPVYELGQREDDTLYYTMKRVRGRTLSDALQDCKTLYDRLALVPHVVDLCQAIAYAHSRGVVHRDIKPENVMLGEFGETVVLDWGLAKMHGQRDLRADDIAREIKTLQDADAGLTTDGATLGTPAYMSPEQAMGDLDAIDEQSDVWSLGAVLYELLTGRPPFQGETVWEVLSKVGNDKITPPREQHDGIPAELASVCMKALQREKGERYSSAGELADEIQAYQTGGRVQAYEYSSWELLGRFISRNKTLTIATVLGLSLLIAGSIMIYREYERAEVSRAREHRERLHAERARRNERLARVQEQDARRKAEQSERKAHKNLSAAFLGNARQLLRRQQFAGAEVFAAASLLHNPHNPRSPWKFPHAGPPRSIRENEMLAGAQSVLYRVSLERVVSLHRTLPKQLFRTWRIAFSSDGGYLAFGGESDDVWLWSLSDRKYIGPFKAPAKPVIAVAFSPDGKLLAAAGGGGAVRIWSVPDGKSIATLKAHARLATAIDFAPDGQSLATAGTDRSIRIWDLKTWRVSKTFTHPNISVWAVRFSPDGKLIASAGWKAGGASRVRLWEVRSRRAVATLSDHIGPVWSLAFSPDGKTLVSAGLDKVVRVYNVRKARLQRVLRGHTGDVTSVAFSPDGRRLATAGVDRTLRLWEVGSWRYLGGMEGHSGQIWGVAFSPDGRRLASSSWDRSVKLWRVHLKRDVKRLPAPSPMVSTAFSGSGTLLVGGGLRREFITWRLSDGKPVASFRPDLKSMALVAVSPKAPQLAVLHPNRTIWVWDLLTGRRLWILTGQRRDNTTALAYRDDGLHLAAGDAKGGVRVWDMTKRKPAYRFSVGKGQVAALAYAPDGTRLAVASRKPKGGPITLWAPATGKRVAVLAKYTGGVSHLAWSRDGRRIAAACEDYAIRIWEPKSGRLIRTLVGHGDDVFSVSWSPDGRKLVSISRDNSVRVWHADSGLLFHTYEVNQISFRAPFSPDGRGIAVAGPRGVRLLPILGPFWKADPRKLLREAERGSSRRLEGFALRTIP